MGMKLSCDHSSRSSDPAQRDPRLVAVAADAQADLPFGTLGSWFFEPESTAQKETWTYVGEGRGGYTKVQSFNYVGDGNGTFHKEVVASASCTTRLCQCFLVTAILGAALYIVAPMTPIGRNLRLPKVADMTNAVLPSFSSSAAANLTAHQPSAALGTQGASAAATTDMPRASALPFVVNEAPKFACATTAMQAVAFSEWAATDGDHDGRVTTGELNARASSFGRSMQKLTDADVDGDGALIQALARDAGGRSPQWRNRRAGADESEFLAALATSRDIAAKALTETGLQFDRNFEAWTVDRRNWCCLHTGIACTGGALGEVTPVTVTGEKGPNGDPYDCAAELDAWKEKWSMGKKDYCCRHYSHGCSAEQGGGAEERTPKGAAEEGKAG